MKQLVKIILICMAIFYPSNRLSTQEGAEIVSIALPEITVEVVRPEIIRKIGDAYSQQDPTAQLVFANSLVNTAIPGVSKNPYVDVPFGGQLYINGIAFLGQAYPNFGLVSAFSGHNNEIRLQESTALTPAMDASIDMRTRVERGNRINISPLQISLSGGRVGKLYTIGASAEFQGAMPFLQKSIRDGVSILGGGPRASFTAEIGEKRKQISAEAHWSRRHTDFDGNTATQSYNGTLNQGFFTLRGNLPLGATNVELVTNYQFSAEQSEVSDEAPTVDVRRDQRIDYATTRGTLTKSTAKLGVALYHLKKTDLAGNTTEFFGKQVFGEKVFLFPLELVVRVNGRVDLNHDTHTSLYFSAFRQFGPVLAKISAGQLYDPVISQKTADNVAGFTSENNNGQQITYGKASLEYVRGDHIVRVSVEPRKVDLPQYYTKSVISGTSYRVGYEWTNDVFFVSFGAVYRDLVMKTHEKKFAAPLSSRFEGKLSGGMKIGRTSVGVVAAVREHTMFPTFRDSLVDLGPQIILTPFVGIEKGPFAISLSTPNTLGLFGVKNYAGAHNGERIALPGIVLLNLKYEF